MFKCENRPNIALICNAIELILSTKGVSKLTESIKIGMTETLQKRVMVLNNLPPPSAIYRYSNDVVLALGGQGELVNMLYDSSKWSSMPSIKNYRGRFGNHYIVNATLVNTAFKSLRDNIRDHIRTGNFIHYAHESSSPFDMPLDRSVVTVHEDPKIRLKTDLYSNNAGTLSEFIIKRFRKRLYDRYKQFDNVLTVSETVKNGLLDYGFRGNIKVIYPPVSAEFKLLSNKMELRKKLGFPTDKRLVLSVSSTNKRKNLQMVKNVVERLGDNYTLIHIGENIGSGLTFRNVPGSTLNEIYNACDLLLFPTLAEGYGYPVVEAFSVGLPVVSSDIEVIRETAGNAAILVDPNSMVDLVSGVKEAIALQEDLRAKGLKRSVKFSFNSFQKEIIGYYASLSHI